MTSVKTKTETKTTRELDALDYEAPFLIEKLVKDQIVETAEEAEELFMEVKRFLVLIRTDTTMWDMYSRRVDEAWHQFVLFTSQYVDFCKRYFGTYIHHSPGISDGTPGHAGPAVHQHVKETTGNAQTAEVAAHQPTSFEGFRNSYQNLFGQPLSHVWWDFTSVNSLRRVLNDDAERMTVRDGEPGMVDLVGADNKVLMSVSDIAGDALAFIANTRGFYVRELPGLTDEEKVGIVTALVRNQVLRVAP